MNDRQKELCRAMYEKHTGEDWGSPYLREDQEDWQAAFEAGIGAAVQPANRAVLQQALDALEEVSHTRGPRCKEFFAIEALRAALAAPQPAQEPVLGAYLNFQGGVTLCSPGHEKTSFGFVSPLYADLQPQPTQDKQKATMQLLIKSLESERSANARLTAELDELVGLVGLRPEQQPAQKTCKHCNGSGAGLNGAHSKCICQYSTQPAQPVAETTRIAELEKVIAEAYQVVGSLLSDLGQFENEQAERVLDNLGEMRRVHGDVLPWTSFERPAAAIPEPLTSDQVSQMVQMSGYDAASPGEIADFINGIRHAEAAHGITGAAPQPGDTK